MTDLLFVLRSNCDKSKKTSMSKEWCLKMAKLEDGYDVSAVGGAHKKEFSLNEYANLSEAGKENFVADIANMMHNNPLFSNSEDFLAWAMNAVEDFVINEGWLTSDKRWAEKIVAACKHYVDRDKHEKAMRLLNAWESANLIVDGKLRETNWTLKDIAEEFNMALRESK